jgi:hypothetical protein
MTHSNSRPTSKKPLSNLIIPTTTLTTATTTPTNQQQQQQQIDIQAINQTLSSPINSSFPLFPTNPQPNSALQLDIESEDDEEEDPYQPSTSHYRQFGDIENEEILHSGYLLKKGERRKTWKRRWFVLRKTCLVYYKNEKVSQTIYILNNQNPSTHLFLIITGILPLENHSPDRHPHLC